MGQILVKIPRTTNGRDPILDAAGKIQYKETILEDRAKPILDKMNAKLPQHLRKIITVVGEEAKQKPAGQDYTKWGIKKIQAELEEREIPFDDKADKAELALLLKNDDDAKAE